MITSSDSKNSQKDCELGQTVTTSDGEMTLVSTPQNLERGFKGRQVNMLAIAGAIGTGLIIGSGQGLARAGPASLFLAYCITGSIIYFVMTAMGEMSAFLPMDQGFSGYAERFVDPALGFATGWNYFFKYATVLANNLTAAGLIIQYWRPDLNVGIWVTVFAVLVITINVLHVGSFGEPEFVLSSIKIATLVMTLWRICVFYIIGVLLLGMVVPYNNKRLVGATKAKTSAAAPPYVIAIQLSGIKVLPDVINACLLVFVTSAANTDIYVGARTLYSLAKAHQAPAVFMKTTSKGVPIYGVAATSAFALLAYLNVSSAASTVFGYFVSLVTVFGTLNWINILVSGPLQPYGAYFALAMTVLITFFNGYNAFMPKFRLSTFMTCYIGIAVYLVNIVGWKLIHRTKRVKPKTMDLETDRKRFEEMEQEEAINATMSKSNWFGGLRKRKS
ncbi:hypothetical protein N0V94_009054 [Neodidymelliopsis sp. IMI 364377]|nr:hypothetical protein N0V94_009054 [Neodidymelliopsis sp. IMI 364377]